MIPISLYVSMNLVRVITRYFMVNEVAFGGDGDFSDTSLVNCINAKLSNERGNLMFRTLSFAYKHCGGLTPGPASLTEADEEMLQSARELLPQLCHL